MHAITSVPVYKRSRIWANISPKYKKIHNLTKYLEPRFFIYQTFVTATQIHVTRRFDWFRSSGLSLCHMLSAPSIAQSAYKVKCTAAIEESVEATATKYQANSEPLNNTHDPSFIEFCSGFSTGPFYPFLSGLLHGHCNNGMNIKASGTQ